MELTKFVILTLFLTAGYLSFQENNINTSNINKSQIYTQFEEWKQQNGIFYEKESENIYRFSIFIKSLEFIQNYNFKHGDEYLGLTSLSGFTNQEYRQRYLQKSDTVKQTQSNLNLGNVSTFQKINEDGEFPMTNNWVSKGAVGPVFDSGSCYGSWAIGASEALTGIYQIRGNPLIPMSPQQIIDCDSLSGGCRGGSETYAYLYTLQNGIQSLESYPFNKRQGICQYDKNEVVFHNEDALQIRANDAYTIQKYSLQQPLTAKVDASSEEFQNWKGKNGKVFRTFCESQDMNYTVLIVGYNDQSGVDENNKKIYPYYTIKTSYGTKWGEEGYMNIYKKDKGVGQCGLYTHVTFPGYGI